MSLASDLGDVLSDMKTLNARPDEWEEPRDDDGMVLPIDQWDQESWPIKLKDADDFMSKGFAKSIRTSLESGKTSGSTYSGSCSLGSVSETVTGTFTSTDASGGESDGATALLKACQKMVGESASNDDYFQGIVDCCSAIVGKAKVNESLSGTAVPPSTPPPTVPAMGTGQGTIDDSAAKGPLLSALKGIPAAMGSSGSDSAMTGVMAPAILAYFKALIVKMEGQGPLSGIKATSALTGNK